MPTDNQEFRSDAKTIVDNLFDVKMLKEDVTRDDMNAFEDLIQFILESRFKTILAIERLNRKYDETTKSIQ